MARTGHMHLREIIRSARPTLVIHGLTEFTLRKTIALLLIRLAAWLMWLDVRFDPEGADSADRKENTHAA